MHKDWILVPRKADDKMKEAAWDHTPLSMDDMTNEDFGRVWEDMVANIPEFVPPSRTPEWGSDGKALNLEAAAKDALSDIEFIYDATGGWVHDNLYNAMVTLRKYLGEL